LQTAQVNPDRQTIHDAIEEGRAERWLVIAPR
jgi:hypothetical protein